jgi:predicted component of type VI protein secretion system
MPKLELRFENSTLAEFPVALQPIMVGRGPGNDVVIDNLAVSNHHARVFPELDHYVVEDLQSVNGTFVNGTAVQRKILRDGDRIGIGKHTLVFFEYAQARTPSPTGPKVTAPKLDETFLMDSKQRHELLRAATQASAATEPAGAPAPPSPRRAAMVGMLKVLEGKTDQPDYTLSTKLMLIGKSDMATIRLRGWLKPKTAGVVVKRDDGYYVGPASHGKQNVKINGEVIEKPTLLQDGDIIEVSRVRFVFSIFK